MQYPYTSIFPNGIDNRTFFCDVDLKGKPVMDTYNKLISKGKYTEANILLGQQSNVHHYSADLFNFIEAKIKNTQEFIFNSEKYSPHHFDNSEPDIAINEMWI